MNGVVLEWLGKAENDFIAMRALLNLPRPFYDLASYHAQQGVEKLMKAVLISGSALAPRTHDLSLLAKLLHECHPDWRYAEDHLTRLTQAAI